MKSSLRLVVAASLLLSLVPLQRGAAELFSDLYAGLNSIFEPDDNAGLTAFRSLLVPIGGLSEGIASASTAVYLDASFFEANPGATSLLDQTEFSVYHNNWIADTKVESIIYTIRNGNLGFGLMGKWLYLNFKQYDAYGDGKGVGYYSEAIGAVNLSYNLLAGYNFSGLALGATLKGGYRVVPTTITDAVGNSAPAIMADFGLLTRFNALKYYYSRAKNVAIGLSLKNVGPAVLGDPLPTVASFGLAYSPIRPLLFSFDLSKYLNLVDLASSEKNLIYAFGVEGTLTNSVKLTGGFLLKGANPRIVLGSAFDLSPLAISVNYTLDLTTQLEPFNRLSATVTYKLGDRGRAALAKKIDSLYVSGLEFYAKGDYVAAKAAWEAALRLDPRFDPAKESLAVLKGTTTLLEDMKGRQNLGQTAQPTPDPATIPKK